MSTSRLASMPNTVPARNMVLLPHRDALGVPIIMRRPMLVLASVLAIVALVAVVAL